MKGLNKLKLFVVIALIILTLTSCYNTKSKKESNKSWTISEFMLDTIVSITLYEDNPVLIQNAFKKADEKNNTLSYRIKDSDIWNINTSDTNEEIEVNNYTIDIIDTVNYLSVATSGSYDITITPVSDIWGIGTSNAKVPTDEEIKDALQYVDYNNILTNKENSTVKILSNGTMLDLGSVAKGYITEEVKKYLITNDIKSGIINFGGNVSLIGKKPDGNNYVVGIRNPFKSKEDYYATLSLSDTNVVSTGTYERNFEQDNITYHHLLDTNTGYPIDTNIVSVTVVYDNSMIADALSTALITLKDIKSIRDFLLSNNEFNKFIDYRNLGIIIVTNNMDVYTYGYIEDKIVIIDKEFKIKQLIN